MADEVHVLDVATARSAQRRGIARALMTELVTLTKAQPVRHVLLEVRRSNAPAIRLYRSLGFFATNVRRRYYDDGEDAVEMRLVLDETTREVRWLPDEIVVES
ncbi:MAG: GNAT family N-acetyltransferase [Polyangiaceae bacterium]